MNQNLLGRVVVGAKLVVGGVATLASLSGCEGGGLGGLLGSTSAMKLLSPLVKDAANSCVSNLS